LIILFSLLSLGNLNAQSSANLSSDPFNSFASAPQYKEEIKNSPIPEKNIYKCTIKIDLEKGYFYKDKTNIKITGTFKKNPEIKIISSEKEKKDPFSNENILVYYSPFRADVLIYDSPETAAITLEYQGCAGEVCLMPVEKIIKPFENETNTNGLSGQTETKKNDSKIPENKIIDQNEDIQEKTLFSVLLMMFLAGIAASMTPCVWPMIPVTVGILGSMAKGSRLKGFLYSLVYVSGISITYAFLGIIAAKTGAAFGEFSSNPYVIVIVSAVFFIFGLAMFDLFTIQLSGNATAFLQKQRSGITGVFLMGLLAGLVASPCIAPVVASLLAYVAKTGNIMIGAAGLAAFAWGMGILFVILGTFSGIMNYLPKSGMWMVKVKYLMGLLMIFASLYFIHPLLNESVFKYILAGLLILFSISKIPAIFSDNSAQTSEIIEKTVVLIMFTTGVTLIVLLTDSLFFPKSHPNIQGLRSTVDSLSQDPANKASNFWYKDYTKGLKAAEKENKNIIIDFYTDWCVQCKKLDNQVFKSTAFIEASQNIIKIKINMTKGKINPQTHDFLKNTFNIWGYPRVVFLNSRGKEIKNLAFDGFLDKKEVIKRIQSIL
jgi:thiol:disulfide interchange protein DsbD